MAKSEKKEQQINMAQYNDLVTKVSNSLLNTHLYNAYKDNKLNAETARSFPQIIAKCANALNPDVVFTDDKVNAALQNPEIGPEGLARDANGFLNDYLYDVGGDVQTNLDSLIVPGFKKSVADSQLPYDSYFILKHIAGAAGVAVDEEKLMDKTLKDYLTIKTSTGKNVPEFKAALDSLVGAYIDKKVSSLKTTDAEKKRERWYLEKYSKYMTSGMYNEAVVYFGKTSKITELNAKYAEAIGNCNDNKNKLSAIAGYETEYNKSVERANEQAKQQKPQKSEDD
ncbi:MAG: hypothetical protein PHC66_02020 [Candidatus Nanoarchaeia archaeon]|nr:hypothetical protein [Candidatus Nanoarchaeia archaeon]MDD5239748.1 hypothetical protein [Candidatus Nanoarchaeia archaeon]